MSIGTGFRSLLAKRIKQLRKKAGLNQVELAAKLNIDRSAISYYESGRIQPSMDILLNLAKLFKVHPATLFLNHDLGIGRQAMVKPKVEGELAAVFGRKLRIMRQRAFFTSEELAKAVGISKGYMSELENGRSSPSFPVLEAIAKALETHPASLLIDVDFEKL